MVNRLSVVAGSMFGVVLLVAMVDNGPLLAQADPQAAFNKIADSFSQAWAQGDAKAIAALHTKDAVRITGNGEPPVKGTAAIEKAIVDALTGPYKGTALNIKQNAFTRVTADTYVGEGTYEITGGNPPAGTPVRGQYMNTLVRQGGRWLIAASAVMPAMMQK